MYRGGFDRLRAFLLREKTAFQFRNLRPVGALLQTFRQPSAAASDLFHGPDDGGMGQRMSDVLSLRRQLQADTGDLIKAPLRPFILLILEGQLLGNTPDAGLPSFIGCRRMFFSKNPEQVSPAPVL